MLGHDPELFHLVQRCLIEAPALTSESPFDGSEAPFELGVCSPQCPLGIDAEMPGEVGDGEEEIADLILDSVSLAG